MCLLYRMIGKAIRKQRDWWRESTPETSVTRVYYSRMCKNDVFFAFHCQLWTSVLAIVGFAFLTKQLVRFFPYMSLAIYVFGGLDYILLTLFLIGGVSEAWAGTLVADGVAAAAQKLKALWVKCTSSCLGRGEIRLEDADEKGDFEKIALTV